MRTARTVLALLALLGASACLGGQGQHRTLRVTSALDEGDDPDEPGPRRVERAPAASTDPEFFPDEEDLGYEDRSSRVLTRGDGLGGAVDPAPARQVRRVRAEAPSRAEPGATEVDRLDLPSDEVFRPPLAHPVVTSPFGMRRDPIQHRRRRMHRGIDYRGALGTPVYATASGRAIMAGYCDRGTGNCIVLDHPHRWRSQYFHLSRVVIHNGDWVEQGQHIGDIGSTGRSTGPHLHFQLGRDGQAIDPATLYGTALNQ